MLPFSKYVVKTIICDKAGIEMFTLFDHQCCVLIDDCVSNLLRKISHGFSVFLGKNVEYNSIFLYNENLYNIIAEGNIKSHNILNEILEERQMETSKLHLSDPLYTIFGFVSEIRLNVLLAVEEVKSIAEFFFGRFSDAIASDIFYGYFVVYFPILPIHVYNSMLTDTYSPANEIWDSLASLQDNINEIEVIDPDDLEFVGDVEIKNIFLVYFINIYSEHLNTSVLMNNIVFLGDMFLEIFNKVNISDTVSSIVLQTPQLVAQKGFSLKDISRTSTYRITVKGSIVIFGGLVTYTNEFDIKKCRLFLSFGDHTVGAITNENILMILDHVIGMLSNNFVQISLMRYNIDFFNVKCEVRKNIDMSAVTACIKRFSEYFFIVNDSSKSVYTKYRIGQVQNVLGSLYNKLYSLINRGEEPTQEQIYRYKVEYGLEYEDIITMIDDVKMKITSSFREKGISISLTQSYINISGLNSVDNCERIIFVINRIINLATINRSKVHDRVYKQRIENEYMIYVKMLDTYLKNKTDVYWCKACQNYGNKVRKPVMYKQLPTGYKFEESTNTYINKQGTRILEIEKGVYFGCDERRSNPNKYIGFIKTCSLCCFQEDVFLAQTNVARRRIKACWNTNIKTENTKYIYNYSKMIGDISLMLEEMEPYFKSDYLCMLIHAGPLDLKPRVNEIVFNGPIILNPQMWKHGKPYSIYIYQNPFLHKVVARANPTLDLFETTPIDAFIRSTSRLFDAAVPHNVYKFFFDNENIIDKYSYVEGMHTVIFILKSGLIICIVDKSLQFGEYVGMFEDLRYVNKYTIPSLRSNSDILQQIRHLSKLHGASAILIDTGGKVLGLSLGLSIYLVISPLSEQEFSHITNREYDLLPHLVNITISSVVRSDIHLTDPAKLVDIPTFESYMHAMFKYRFFVYLNQNTEARADLLKIVSHHTAVHERYREVLAYVNNMITHSDIIYETSKINHQNIDINNDISTLFDTCSYPFRRLDNNKCVMQLTQELKEKLITNLINELVYPYSSVYVYTSKFVNSSYSQHMIDTAEFFSSRVLVSADVKYVSGQLVQEIYPFGADIPFMCLYRALANIYFWLNTEGELNITRRNLGYFSKSQTYLAYYVHQIINSTSISDIIDAFESHFNLHINVNMENEAVKNYENAIYTLYMNIRNGSIINISVGILIDSESNDN